jgi:hypothetical protein
MHRNGRDEVRIFETTSLPVITRLLDQRPDSRGSNMLGLATCCNLLVKEKNSDKGQRKEIKAACGKMKGTHFSPSFEC